MADYDYDIGVLGGGSAGLTVTAGAAQAAPIGWGPEPVLTTTFPRSLAVAKARLAEPPRSAQLPELAASGPLSLPSLRRVGLRRFFF